MKRIGVTIFALLATVVSASRLHGYELPTHRLISLYAFERVSTAASVLGAELGLTLTASLQGADGRRLTLSEWIQEGSAREDDAFSTFELARVRHHDVQAGVEALLDPNALGNGMGQKLERLLDDLVEVHGRELSHALARGREEAAGELRAPYRRALDGLDVLRRRRPVLEVGTQKRRVAQDPSEDVVEVVRDAARERADHFELLTLPELVLELAELGHVPHR